MTELPKGFEIPGSTPCTTFARKPASYIDQAVNTGQPLLLLRRNRVMAAIVPIGSLRELEQYLQIRSAS